MIIKNRQNMSANINGYLAEDEKTIQGSVECFLEGILDRVVEIDKHGPFLDRNGSVECFLEGILDRVVEIDKHGPFLDRNGSRLEGSGLEVGQGIHYGNLPLPSLSTRNRIDERRQDFNAEIQKVNGFKQGLTQYMIWRKEERGRAGRKLARKSSVKRKKRKGFKSETKNVNVLKQGLTQYKIWRKEERKARKVTRKTHFENSKKVKDPEKSHQKDVLKKNLVVDSGKCKSRIVDHELAEVTFIDENMCGDGTEMLLYGDNKEIQRYKKDKFDFWKRVIKSVKKIFKGDKTTTTPTQTYKTVKPEYYEAGIYLNGGLDGTMVIGSELEIELKTKCQKKTFGDKLRKVFGRRSVHT